MATGSIISVVIIVVTFEAGFADSVVEYCNSREDVCVEFEPGFNKEALVDVRRWWEEAGATKKPLKCEFECRANNDDSDDSDESENPPVLLSRPCKDDEVGGAFSFRGGSVADDRFEGAGKFVAGLMDPNPALQGVCVEPGKVAGKNVVNVTGNFKYVYFPPESIIFDFEIFFSGMAYPTVSPASTPRTVLPWWAIFARADSVASTGCGTRVWKLN